MPTADKIREKARQKWDLKKAGERLLWRFNSGNSFVPNEKDVAALHCVLGFINRQTAVNITNNTLFAKLYIYHLTMNIRYHETTVLNPLPVNELHRTLSKPLKYFFKAFYCDLHDNQLNKLITADDVEKKDVIAEYERLKQTFTEDYVLNKLNEQMSNALNLYS